MKKGLIITLATIFVLSIAGTALADDSSSASSPLTVSGSFKYEFRYNNEGAWNGVTEKANRMAFGLNFDYKADANTDVFARLGGQFLDDGGWNNPDTGTSATSGGGLDEMGVKANYGDWTFALGRQGVQLGQGSVFYSGLDIDPLTYFDGLVASTKFNDINFKVIGGKAVSGFNYHGIGGADNSNGYNPQDWVGVDLSGNTSKITTIGAVYANKSGLSNTVAYGAPDTTRNANYWGVNVSTKIGDALALNGEYAKSNAASENAAYTVSGTYSWTKDSFTLAYNSVQGNSVDPVNSAIGSIYYPNGAGFVGTNPAGANFNGYTGFTYAYHHDLSKVLGFNAYLMSMKPYSSDPGTDNEYGVNLKWSF